MNSVSIAGNLTRDVEMKDGRASFSVAVNRVWAKDGVKQEDVDYIPVVVFGNQAENCQRYLHKGSKVGVEGRLSVHKYEKDGQPRTYTSVVARAVEFLSPKSTGGNTTAPPVSSESECPFVDGMPHDAVRDEEVPF